MSTLFKYVPKVRVDIIENLQIRFSPPACMNDLFEVSPEITDNPELDYLKGLSDDQYIDQLAFFWDSSPEIQDSIPRDLFLALNRIPGFREFSYKQLETIPKEYAKQKRNQFVNSEIGILSLTEFQDSETMWAHYASDHTGFVIGFDIEHKFLNSPFGDSEEYNKPHRVEYTDERPKSGIATSTTLEKFLIKSNAWSYEKEWRVIKLLRAANKEIHFENTEYPVHLFSIPPESLQSICLGSRISSILKERIKSLLATCLHFSHVKLYQATPCPNTFKILINEEPKDLIERDSGGWQPIPS